MWIVLLIACLLCGCSVCVAFHSSAGHSNSTARRHAGMKFYALENSLHEQFALKKLTDAIHRLSRGRAEGNYSAFADIMPSVLFQYSTVTGVVGREQKHFIGQRAIASMGRDYVAYGVGIANNPAFEEYLVQLGATVHGFDCTVPVANATWTMAFHSWCIGDPKVLYSSAYAKDVLDKELTFHRFRDIMHMLNHSHVDLLKLDIEGSEWDLFYQELLHLSDSELPTQLLFELHTEGAKEKWIPPAIVKGKTRLQVDQLVLALYHRGYRVFSVVPNVFDPFCAEVGMFRVGGL